MWKKIAGGVILLIVLAVSISFYATSGITKTAENFFSAAGAGRYDEAYGMLSKDFRQNVSKDQMIAFLKRNGFSRYKSASWGNRSVEGRRGEVEGSVETEGGAIPVTVKMIKDSEGAWKIYAISKPDSGIVKEKSGKENPEKTAEKSAKRNSPETNPAEKSGKAAPLPEEKVREMVRQTIHFFVVGIAEKNMKALYDSTAENVRRQYTLDQINGIYKKEFESGVDFSILEKMEPRFSEPLFFGGGKVLKVRGYYPTRPSRFYFEITYQYENGEWKLLGISTEAKAETESSSAQNGAKTYVALVKKTMHTFALSVNEKSMRRMHGEMAEVFRKQMSVEEMNGKFGSFLSQQVDLTVLDPLDPLFDKKPEVNADGILELRGHYQTTPTVLHFDFRYYREKGVWKPVGISVWSEQSEEK